MGSNSARSASVIVPNSNSPPPCSVREPEARTLVAPGSLVNVTTCASLKLTHYLVARTLEDPLEPGERAEAEGGEVLTEFGLPIDRVHQPKASGPSRKGRSEDRPS